jgi:hypothetical protein
MVQVMRAWSAIMLILAFSPPEKVEIEENSSSFLLAFLDFF